MVFSVFFMFSDLLFHKMSGYGGKLLSGKNKNAPKPFSGFRANDDHPRSHLNSLSRRENALSPVTRADGEAFPPRGSQTPSPPA